jgi:hypothetical protein
VIKTLGYILFIVCCLAWLMILVIPFLGYTKGETAGIITGLVIFGEVTFYVSILMLGKTFYNKIRERFRLRRNKPENGDNVEKPEG